MTVEERIQRIEEMLEKSGVGLLAQMEVGKTLSENLGLLMEPQNLQLLSLLAQLIEQKDALEKLTGTLEKLDKSGALAFMGHLAEHFGEGLGMLMEPRVLRLISHGANVLDLLSRVEPTAIGMTVSAAQKAMGETLSLEVIQHPPKVGLTSLFKQLSDPEVQEALGILFLLLKALSRTVHHVGEEVKNLEAMRAKMTPKS